MGAPLVKAEQNRAIRVENLPEVFMGGRRLRLAKERLVPFEAARQIAYANDGPRALQLRSSYSLTLRLLGFASELRRSIFTKHHAQERPQTVTFRNCWHRRALYSSTMVSSPSLDTFTIALGQDQRYYSKKRIGTPSFSLLAGAERVA